MIDKRHLRRTLLVGAMLALAAACSQPTPDQLMAKARQAVSAGQARTAQIHLKNLLRQTPDDAAARALLGQVSLTLGDAVGAEADLRRALELGADPAVVQLPLLRTLGAQGKFADVIAQIDKGPALEGRDRIDELLLAGSAHRALGQAEEADAVYQQALALDPESADVRTDIAELRLEQGRVKDARDLIVGVLKQKPDFGPALLLRGQVELQAGRFADAEATFRQIVDTQGKRGSLYFQAESQRIDALLAQGSIDAAATGADELLAAYPNQPLAIVLKADVEVAQGALDDARQRLEALVAKAPKFEPANRLLGTVNARQGRAEQAQMYLQSAVTQNPSDRQAMLQLAGLKMKAGDLDATKKLLSDAVKPAQPKSDAVLFALAGLESLKARDNDLSAAFFEQSGRDMTGNVQDLVAVSAVYAASGQLDRAQELLRGASGEIGKDAWVATYVLALTQIRQGDLKAADATIARLAGQRPAAPWPLNLRGIVALMSKDSAAARRYYDAALKLDSKYIPALLNLSSVDVFDGKPDQAIADLHRVLAIDPKQVKALTGLAELALRKRDYAEAKKWIDELPDSPGRSTLDGTLALAQGRVDDAADRFAQAFAAAPSADTALQAFAAAERAGRADADSPLLSWVAEHPNDPRVNLALGELALKKGENDAAIGRFENVVATDPKQPVALNNLAWLYSRKGDGRALEMARRAHDAAPDNAAVADTLGWLELQSGDAAAALPLLEKSHAAEPKNAEIHYHWAAALAKNGKEKQAAQALRDLLAGKADFEGRGDAQRLLEELQ